MNKLRGLIKFLADRFYFKIHWVVRKFGWSLFGVLTLRWPFTWAGFPLRKSAALAGALIFLLALVKEIYESYHATVLSQSEGGKMTFASYFKQEGMKDLAPVFVGIAIAVGFLLLKAQGL